jgi:hypothetical protein
VCLLLRDAKVAEEKCSDFSDVRFSRLFVTKHRWMRRFPETKPWLGEVSVLSHWVL